MDENKVFNTLVNGILKKDITKAESAFNALLMAKTMPLVRQKQIDVAQKMFQDASKK